MEKLGQHFLINKNKINKIIDSLELKSGDTIIEIGPGHGELTSGIRNYELGIRVIAIEKDKKLINDLQKNFSKNKNVKIIEGDALKILPKIPKNQNLKPKTYKIVGNIPYYITGYLLRIIGELKNKPSLIILTIQKEVVERIVAKPPKMNLLAASVQFWAEPEIIDYILKKDFKPAPEVDSAIIKLIPKTQNLKLKTYYSLIKIIFKQPRKTILNNILEAKKDGYQRKKMRKEKIIEKLNKVGVNSNDRPQNLSIEQIKQLSTLF